MKKSIAMMTSQVGRWMLAAGCVSFAALGTAVMAADNLTDVASEPMITSSSSSVKPNLFFVLDNSGSMDWDFLPDVVVGDQVTGTALRVCKGNAVGTTEYCCRTDSGSTFGTGWSACLPQSNYRGMPPFHNSAFNTLYYNPEVYYQVPQDSAGNVKTSYSGAGAVPWDGYGVQSTSSITLTSGFPDVEWCTDNSYTDCLRNDNYLLPGVVGGQNYATMHVVRATGTGRLAIGTPQIPAASASTTFGPYYYVMVPAEYCDSTKQTSCSLIDKTLSDLELARVARVRWCSDAGLTDCKLTRSGTYSYPRYPTIVLGTGAGSSATAVMGVSGVSRSNCSGTTGTGRCGAGTAGTVCVGRSNVVTVNSIRVAGTTEILSGPFVFCDSSWSSSTRNANLAWAISVRINAAGFSATAASANVTVVAPVGTTYNGQTVAGTISAASLSSAVFNNNGSAATGTVVSVPGSFKRIDIVSGQTYGNILDGYGNTIVDRSNRTDCASRPDCTYAEELQNFANWMAWYRSRMQMMKSAVGLAFQSADDHFRAGYFTINSASSNLVNIADFNATQKSSWYARLYAADPGSGTPLRVALANAGRIYAGQTAISGVTDPVQYSCQRNYTIISTDGYWNGNNGTEINGTTAIGNEDGTSSGLARPELDGRDDSATLADVAAYYYNTDLRTGCTGGEASGLCNNNVKTTARDTKQTQHMVTYTIGLGQNGVMQYRKNYLNNPSSEEKPDDYSAVKAGTVAGSSTGVCSWQTTGECNWPRPSANTQENIDDLWHAAVNGHGIYYRADTWKDVSSGLHEIMRLMEAELGAAAAATTSNPNVTAEDNLIFSSSYRSGDWAGDLVLQTFDISTGSISGNVWGSGAGTKITAQGSTGRNIWTFDAGGTAGDRRKSFDWANLNSGTSGICSPPASEQGCFTSPYIDTIGQFCLACLSTAQKADASGANLVDYLRGNQAHEQTAANETDRWYRTRAWDATYDVLGDIVSSEAVYVGKYLYNYGGGYPAGTTRAYPTVYVAANDGMLHAIDATADSSGGGERWAYVPSMVFRNMYKLADIDYGAMHRYFVDGTPTVADIESGGGWKTILVGGLAGGGPGYYALEIDSNGGGTNQTQPKVLWELRNGALVTSGASAGQINNCTSSTSPRYASLDGVTADCDLGLSFGNPVIGKVGGTWVVMVTSGYNNINGGDGKGHLYVLDAMTGEILRKIDTSAGSGTAGSADPSGLGRINGWVDDAMKDNTITTVYGGDLQGNMWAFDPAAGSVRLLINVGNPITAKPELGEVSTSSGAKKKVVFFPTGRLLGTADVSSPLSGNYFYGVWDDGTTADISDLSTVTGVSTGSSNRTRSSGELTSVFEVSGMRGWRLPFEAGEQGNTDPTLAFGTLVFSTNKPTTTTDACNQSGFGSWVYNIDWLSGGPVDTSSGTDTYMATYYSEAATRPNVIVVDGIVKSITRLSDATNKVQDVLIKSQPGAVRRVSWRELVE